MALQVVSSPASASGCALVLAMVVGFGGGMTLPGWGSALSDDFDAATPIHGLTNVFGSNVGATAQPGEPAHFGEPAHHSLWAKWTADATATYTVATTNSTFDTVLAVYLGT